MKCEEIQNLIAEYLSGALDADIRKHFDEHISDCSVCRREFEAMSHVWATMGIIPDEEPASSVRTRFYSMLEVYRYGMSHAPAGKPWVDKLSEWLGNWWPRRPVYQLGLTAAVLIFGIGIGQWMNINNHKNGEIAQLREEMAGMRELVTISLLNQSSAVDRLQGVSMSRLVTEPDEKFLSALFRTLNSDPNVNVRLAVTDALQRFSGSEQVRTRLVESLSSQTSPLVQIALINLLVNLKEQKAVDVFRDLTNDKNTIEPVKVRARMGIDKII
ncbi:HEAT repeat domain-containing protein [bacterium]|nr:HEAT repeat domain-containing protein [bacterium]